MRHPEFPEPIGIFRDVDRPMYDRQLNAQIEEARSKRGPGSLEALFNTGDTWVVE
jgi:2-oxoglutarate ferredoxin oxidoreductase subunit beta